MKRDIVIKYFPRLRVRTHKPTKTNNIRHCRNVVCLRCVHFTYRVGNTVVVGTRRALESAGAWR